KTGHTQNTQQKHIHNNQANGKTTKKTENTTYPKTTEKTSSCFPKNILMFSKNMNMNLQSPQNTNTTTAKTIATQKKETPQRIGHSLRRFFVVQH
ncbi:MAG: hypothetical protein K2F69_02675, partial [Bacteroidaceae bacterium]|nr:hypothetical protein [Bacteroidaceae bacterium]